VEAAPPTPAPAEPAFEPPPKPAVKPPKRETPDAGAPDSGAPDAGARDAGADAGERAADAGGPKITDPVALVGEAGKVADANANVRLIIHNEVIRSHPLGPRIGTLLASVYQWRDFFGPTRIDPVKDIERMYIAGPQLRDSSSVVVILQHNTSEQRMRQAVDVLVKRDPQGKWLQTRVPAAVAHADRAERYFVFPGPRMVVVAPPSASKSALDLGPNKKIPPPKHGEAMTAYVVTPWRVFMGTPLNMPKTIKWVLVEIVPRADGGLVAELEAEDESDDAATKDAKLLEDQINSVAHLKLGFLSVLLGRQTSNFVERVSFTSEGTKIRGTVSANAGQVSMLFDLIGAAIAQYQHEARPAPAVVPKAFPGGPVSPTPARPAPPRPPTSSAVPPPPPAPPPELPPPAPAPPAPPSDDQP
jgi:hypothetical protein